MRWFKVIGLSVGLVCALACSVWASEPRKPDSPWVEGPAAPVLGPSLESALPGSPAPGAVLADPSRVAAIAAIAPAKPNPWFLTTGALMGGYQLGPRPMQPLWGGLAGFGYQMVQDCHERRGSFCIEGGLQLTFAGGVLQQSQAPFFQTNLGLQWAGYVGPQRVFAPYLGVALGYRYQLGSATSVPLDAAVRLTAEETGSLFFATLGGGLLFHFLGKVSGPALYMDAAASLRLGGFDGFTATAGLRYRF